jgi:hypothetical protein
MTIINTQDVCITNRLKELMQKTIILIGVAHRARNFSLQDKIILEILPIGSHGELKVSDLNAEIMERLPKSISSS